MPTNTEMRRRIVQYWVYAHTTELTDAEEEWLVDLCLAELFPTPTRFSLKSVNQPVPPIPTAQELLEQFPLDIEDNDVDFGMSPPASPHTSPAVPDADEPAVPGETTPLEEVTHQPPPVEVGITGETEVALAVESLMESVIQTLTESPLGIVEVKSETEPEPTVNPATILTSETRTATDTDYETALQLARKVSEGLLYRKDCFEPYVQSVMEGTGLEALQARRLANKAYAQIKREENTSLTMAAVLQSPVKQNGHEPSVEPTTDPDARQCTVCGKLLERRSNEPTGNFANRKTCSPACRSVAISRGNNRTARTDRHGIAILD
jgi:hypothetical protein